MITGCLDSFWLVVHEATYETAISNRSYLQSVRRRTMDAYQAEQFELQEKIDDLQRTANELIAQYLKPNSQN
jgi:hypothetical protein